MNSSAVLSGIPIDRPQAITAPLENTGLPSWVVAVNSGIAPVGGPAKRSQSTPCRFFNLLLQCEDEGAGEADSPFPCLFSQFGGDLHRCLGICYPASRDGWHININIGKNYLNYYARKNVAQFQEIKVGRKPGIIKIDADQLKHLTITDFGAIIKRTDFEPELPEERRNKLAERYSEAINNWLDLFCRGRRAKVREQYAPWIIRELLKHGEIPYNFDSVSLIDLTQTLVRRKPGRPLGDNGPKFGHRQILSALLEDLVDFQILDIETRGIHPHYSINTSIFRTHFTPIPESIGKKSHRNKKNLRAESHNLHERFLSTESKDEKAKLLDEIAAVNSELNQYDIKGTPVEVLAAKYRETRQELRDAQKRELFWYKECGNFRTILGVAIYLLEKKGVPDSESEVIKATMEQYPHLFPPGPGSAPISSLQDFKR